MFLCFRRVLSSGWKSEVNFYLMGLTGNVDLWKNWRGHCVPHPLPLKGVVTRGIRKQRESLGHELDSAAVEKREDLRLSSEVVYWQHRVAHFKSIER